MDEAKKIKGPELDLRTPAEKRRDNRDAAICQEFIALVKQHPKAKPYRLFSVIGDRYGMSSYGVAKVLGRCGYYHTK